MPHRRVAFFLPLVLFLAGACSAQCVPPSIAQQLASCPRRIDPRMELSAPVKHLPAGYFRWCSNEGPAGSQGGASLGYAVEVSVSNLSQRETLKYDWPVGRLHNSALPKEYADVYCEATNWPNQGAGKIAYGRGNREADTQVWTPSPIAQSRRSSGSFLIHFSTKRGPGSALVRVTSSVLELGPHRFHYDYVFENLQKEPVRLFWGVGDDTAVMETLRHRELSTVFFVKGRREVQFDSARSPTHGVRRVDVMVNGEDVAGVAMQMILPGRHFALQEKER